MDNLIKPIIVESSDYCSNCRTQRSIELYNIFNKPVGYRNILKFANIMDLEPIFDKYPLSHMKCKKCGKIYKIYWKNNKPLPLKDNIFYSEFLYNFSK